MEVIEMKENYESPKMEIVEMDLQDGLAQTGIITSGTGDE